MVLEMEANMMMEILLSHRPLIDSEGAVTKTRAGIEHNSCSSRIICLVLASHLCVLCR